MVAPRDRAKQLLQHYFRTVFERAGLEWDSDNNAEMEELVDELVDAVIDTIRTLETEPRA